MTNLIFSNSKYYLGYNKESKTFFANEKDVPFDTSYEIKNPKTGNSMSFDFSHSTGSEWDPNTSWVYVSKSNPEIKFIVSNDAETTKANADSYLNSKLNKQ